MAAQCAESHVCHQPFGVSQDAAKTALQLGHTESRTLFAHYRELVRPEDAQAFWRIFPEKDATGAKVVSFEETAA